MTTREIVSLLRDLKAGRDANPMKLHLCATFWIVALIAALIGEYAPQLLGGH